MLKYYYRKYAIASYSAKKVTAVSNAAYWPGNDYPACRVYSSKIVMQYTDKTDATDNTLLNTSTGLYPSSSYYYTNTASCEGYGYYRHLVICTPALAYFVRGCKTTPSHTSRSGGQYQCLYMITATATRGSMIGEVLADEGAYPDDGLWSDGYWYVKDRIGVEFKARLGGAWVSAVPWVREGGAWRAAQAHPRVNGAWMG